MDADALRVVTATTLICHVLVVDDDGTLDIGDDGALNAENDDTLVNEDEARFMGVF